jgi:ferric-dicitrate binding protein FerR (iron transport regulator)
LSGEAFFEVAKDKAKPFYVITNDLKIKVTGTRFNVTSYKNDSFTQAVLLEGKIFASKNALFSKEIELVPGERVVLDKGDRHLQKQKVNVEQYASWVDGYLIINDEPINEITKKLERYYDQKIVIERSSQNMRFTGKLNLADDLSKVLQNIAFSAAFTIEHKNDTYIIK